jgi:hypothetical protein
MPLMIEESLDYHYNVGFGASLTSGERRPHDRSQRREDLCGVSNIEHN